MPKQSVPAIFLVADNIRSLYNVGALFRNSDAFGVAKLYLCGYTGTPPSKEIAKTALGAETTVPWEHCRQVLPLLRRLRKVGVRIIALERARGSIALPDFHPRYPLALVVGNEVFGVSPAVRRFSDAVVSIPMAGAKESLNVAVAAGVALYALTAATSRPAA
ncbi:MAG: tRNA/rRNA methyltransferase SpoU [Parcubacteria group bacterium Gr01-1014_31]|nr:MAG: tRNA/rRNA methyltransferase SpoU [Parcubacteria group bacterium Gr01-1014_31]